MLKRKLSREKGKLKLSRYFQEFEPGERITVNRELSLKVGFPKSIQGRVGVIEEKKGRCYIVRINIGKDKRFIIHPVHLKKLKS